jgi:hypothetical protein
MTWSLTKSSKCISQSRCDSHACKARRTISILHIDLLISVIEDALIEYEAKKSRKPFRPLYVLYKKRGALIEGGRTRA